MRLLLLDRDGVINQESPEYIKSPDEWIPLPGSIDAIRELGEAGFTIAIITNQSGVGRGLFSEETLGKIHQKLLSTVRAAGGNIAQIFYCPHHPDDHCACRKPQPGLFHAAQKVFPCDFNQVYFVGDSRSDLLAAKAAGCQPVLVETGYGKITRQQLPFENIPIYADLAALAATLCEIEGVE